MASYIRGLLIVAAYAFTLTFIFARMVIGAGYAPILALAVGGLEILLVIGPTISTIALCVIAVQQESLAMLAAFAIFIAFLRLSIDEFVGPIVIGRAVSLHPVTIMFTLLVGMALLGVLGVLLAVPTAAAIKVFLRHSYGEPSNSWYLREKYASMRRGTKGVGSMRSLFQNPATSTRRPRIIAS